MRCVVLGSGSSGNAVVIESEGRRVLIDAGFSCRELERRMRAVGVEPETVEAVVLTHEHGDHVRGADRFVRRHRVPLLANRGTIEGTPLGPEAGAFVVTVASDRPFEAGPFLVEPFLVPHDAREPLGLVVADSAGRRLGLAGDMGSRSRLAWARLRELDLLVLETNHDLDMLRSGPYPWPLKQRVAGRLGHLSNRDAVDGLEELLDDSLRDLVLYHLSRTNNLPALAAAVVGERLDGLGAALRVTVSHQFEPTPWLEVGE